MNSILHDFKKMKRIAVRFCQQEEWEKALRTIFYACGLMYTMNQKLVDLELEELVHQIAKENLQDINRNPGDEKTVIFYDGFGNIDRGLAYIYLEALLELEYHVIYVTCSSNIKKNNAIMQKMKDGDLCIVAGATYIDKMHSLAEIVNRANAQKVFIYTNPDDVVAMGVFSLYNGYLERILVNLTDHAFWLGKSVSDIVINFREFGYKVCLEKRGFRKEQLAYLPYYPHELQEKFEGFQFEDNSRKLIFSGGALYKTFSKDNKYYSMVEEVLRQNEDVNFLYLGNGDTRKIKKLIRQFPGRAIYETERTDFFEIMKRSTFYLSTYPYNGGLMTQYALLAKRIPVTLCRKGIEKELSVRHAESFWNFDSYNECLSEVDRLLNQEQYRKQKEDELRRFLITKKQFKEKLQYILSGSWEENNISDEVVEFKGFQELPLETFNYFQYCRLFFRKGGFYMIRFFPVKFTLGAAGMIFEKIYKKY